MIPGLGPQSIAINGGDLPLFSMDTGNLGEGGPSKSFVRLAQE